jgi:hypothetical protein
MVPMNRVFTVVFLGFLLLASAGAQADVVQAPVRDAAEVAARFVKAIRAGDAAGIRQCLLAPATDKLRGDQDRWIDTIAKTGPDLPDAQFAPLAQSLGMGEFAVVQGGFGPTPYMRLMKQGGAWKVLAPGDAKVQYGLNEAQSATLAKLEQQAVLSWGKRPTAVQPRAKARVPLNSFAAPTSQPVASDGFYFSPATSAYFAILTTDNFNEQSCIARALGRTGDVASAQQLIPFCDLPDDLRIAGLVAAYSADPTIANARRLRGRAQRLDESELAFGLAAGLAMQGKHEAALAVANSLPPNAIGSGRASARSVVLRHRPTKEQVNAYLREFPAARLGPHEFLRAAEAVILAGEDARVPEMLTRAMERSPSVNVFPDEVRASMVNAYVAAGKRAAANELAGKITSPALLARIEAGFAREPARRGDSQTVLQCAQAAKHGRGEVMNLLVYAQARAGNTVAAQGLCDEAARATNDVSRKFAVRYGMLAAAQNDMRQKDQARATIERATKLINDLSEPFAKRYAFQLLIMSAILGPEYYSHGVSFNGLW